MLQGYKSNCNVVYSSKYHVVWCPKYRRKVLEGEMARLISEGFDVQKVAEAAKLFERVSLDDNYADFLTLPALDMIN